MAISYLAFVHFSHITANMELASQTVLTFSISSKGHYIPVLKNHLSSALVIYLVMTVFNQWNALKYFEDLQDEMEEFALCFRSDLITRGNRTNNFVEAQFLVLKDDLRRVKEYNVMALIDKLTVDLENHYKEKILRLLTEALMVILGAVSLETGRKVTQQGTKFLQKKKRGDSWKPLKHIPIMFLKYKVCLI